MNKTCFKCQNQFTWTEEERAMHSKISSNLPFDLPEQIYCHDCRMVSMIIHRKERYLYERQCDLSGRNIISVFRPNTPFPVYEKTLWHGDSWDATDYGQEYDFNRPFFEQFYELFNKVPRSPLSQTKSENCDYTNYTIECRNSYLSYCVYHSEGSIHSYFTLRCKDCIDCNFLHRCESCINCTDCNDCFNCYECNLSNNCSDCYFLYDCRGCTNCFGCVGLRQKQYCLFNQQLTKEEYHQKIQEWDLQNPDHQNTIKKFVADRKLQHPHLYSIQDKTENCTGDYIFESQNCHNTYQLYRSRDCINVQDSETNDALDTYHGGWSENTYMCSSPVFQNDTVFSNQCWTGSNNLYCDTCISTNNCFGSIGLKHKDYCILNKQYTKEQYEILLPKIIEHLKQTGEWGHYFPAYISPFPYNESVVQQEYPLTKEQALAQGFKWNDHLPITTGKETYNWNQSLPTDITKEILACTNCHKNYRIIAQELQQYKTKNLPFPQTCPECRFESRMKLRNKRKLHNRNCAKCQTEIKTTYSEQRPETIYCQDCYLQSVY